MKILWLNHRDISHPRAGGAERTIIEVGRRLVAMGEDVRLVSGGWSGSDETSTVDGVVIRRYPTPLGPHLALPRLLRGKSGFDVVVDDLAHVIPWCSPMFSSVPGVVVFRHLHARSLRGQVGPLGATLLRKAERFYPIIYRTWPFVTETQGSIDDLVGLGIARNRCRQILPGVDLAMFRPGRKSATPLLVYFGGMRAYKRPDHALRAFAALRQADVPGCKLVMVGDGPELPSLKRLAVALGVGGVVSFPGRLGQRQLSDMLSESWLNLHCSTTEGWGSSTLEAAAAGVPTVGYRVSGLVESVSEQMSGRLVTDGAWDALAEGVLELLPRISDWSVSARRYAEGFSWDSTATEWRRLLYQVAGKTVPP